MTKLIPHSRCTMNPYFERKWGALDPAGVIIVTVPERSPEWKTWDRMPSNPLHFICTTATIDGVNHNVIPVKTNQVATTIVFDTEYGTDPVQLNNELPAIIFFFGNDDYSYALRFATFAERDQMLAEFGEELGLLPTLQGHN